MIAGSFRTSEAILAALAAAGAQIAIYLAFSTSFTSHVRADISDQNSRPFAVSITPVLADTPAGDHRAALPHSWQRHAVPRSVADVEAPFPKIERPHRPEPVPREENVAPASAAPADVGSTAVGVPGTVPSVDNGVGASSQGIPAGTGQGGEADLLRMQAIALYRAELISWFMARFDIRGKIPFEILKTLRAVATVTVTPEHAVGGFRLATESGDPIFDAQVRATLTSIQSSGAILPAPPPLYTDLLGPSLSVSFQCTSRSQCE